MEMEMGMKPWTDPRSQAPRGFSRRAKRGAFDGLRVLLDAQFCDKVRVKRRPRFLNSLLQRKSLQARVHVRRAGAHSPLPAGGGVQRAPKRPLADPLRQDIRPGPFARGVDVRARQ